MCNVNKFLLPHNFFLEGMGVALATPGYIPVFNSNGFAGSSSLAVVCALASAVRFRLLISSFVCLQLHAKTTGRLFVKISLEVYLCTRKSPLNLEVIRI